jgi:hypothetical protein
MPRGNTTPPSQEQPDMKRSIVAVLLCALAGTPTWAQELDLHAIVRQKATELAAFQVPQTPQPPPTTTAGSSSSGKSGKEKALYFGTLGAAVFGIIFNIKETRDALDHRLEARTFPLVWKTTKDPADKGKVSGIIAGANGAILGAGAFVYAKGNTPLGTFVNALVAVATTVISIHDRSIINDCKAGKVICQP